MSSSSTDTTCGGNNELLRGVNTNHEKKFLLGPTKITFVSRDRSNHTPQSYQDGFNSINFVRTPSTQRGTFNETKLIHPQRPTLNGDISKIHPNSLTLSPLVEFIRPTNTDPNNMITANMTIKDRERRAALLADSPELPSKPLFESKMPKILCGKYGFRGSLGALDINSRPSSTTFNNMGNTIIPTSSNEGDDDSSSAGFSTSRQSCRSSSSQSGSSSSSCCCTCNYMSVFVRNNGNNTQGSANYTNNRCSFFNRSSAWKSLLLGQLLSLLLCTMSVLSELLIDTYNTKIPTGQSLLTYALLFIVYFPLFCCQLNQTSQQQQVPTSNSLSRAFRERGLRYLVLAVIDVEANYLLHKAFQYTTFTSIQLLDCFSIPMILVLSWTFLRCRYRLTHIGGMALGLMSVVVLVWVDIDDGKGGISSGGNKRMVGDILTLGSALLFGVSHVGLQHSVYFYNTYEFLGCIGLFGTIITVIQMLILERSALTSGVRWEAWEVSILLAAFAAAQLAYYCCLPYMLKLSTAAELHLSHLATDFYSLVAGVFLFRTNFQKTHLLSVFLVLTGLMLFNLHKVPISPNHRKRSAFSGLEEYHKSEPADSKIPPMYDKDTVSLNNRIFHHRRASTSSVPSPLDVRVITHSGTNGLSPSRRSTQSFRPASRNSYKHQNNHSSSNTFLAIHDRDLVVPNGNAIIISSE